MTATQVFAQRAGQNAVKRALMITDLPRFGVPQEIEALQKKQSGSDRAASQAVEAIQSRVKSTMGKYAAVLRSQEGLRTCADILDGCKVHLEALDICRLGDVRKHINVRNMILAAKLVVRSALVRTESKGPHFREDDPRSL
jgi:L-aspartate oxidase